MRIAIISTFPPDRGNLAEYGSHIALALAQTKGVEEVRVIANTVKGAATEEQTQGYSIHRAWTLDDPLSFRKLIRAARDWKPDVAYVNAGIRTWGKSRRASIAGASVPLMLRAAGMKVVTTLHTIGDTVRLDQHGVSRVTRLGMEAATRLYLQSNLVTVTMPGMQHVLQQKSDSVAHLSHGTWGPLATPPTGGEPRRILSFGFWGAFKDAELLVNATRTLRAGGRDVELVLGGGAHPYFPEIYQRLVERYRSESFVRFTGYVPEAKLAELFTSASVVVLPYRTNAGASGVLNLCRSYARPVVISNEPGLLEQLRFEGGGAIVFQDEPTLVTALGRVLDEPVLQRRLAEANLEVARTVTFQTQAARLLEFFWQVRRNEPLSQCSAPMHEKPEFHPGEATVIDWRPP